MPREIITPRKATPLMNNFSAGELDPTLDARADLNRYLTGCRTLNNFMPILEGGITRIPGTKYIAALKGNQPGEILPPTVQLGHWVNDLVVDGDYIYAVGWRDPTYPPLHQWNEKLSVVNKNTFDKDEFTYQVSWDGSGNQYNIFEAVTSDDDYIYASGGYNFWNGSTTEYGFAVKKIDKSDPTNVIWSVKVMIGTTTTPKIPTVSQIIAEGNYLYINGCAEGLDRPTRMRLLKSDGSVDWQITLEFDTYNYLGMHLYGNFMDNFGMEPGGHKRIDRCNKSDGQMTLQRTYNSLGFQRPTLLDDSYFVPGEDSIIYLTVTKVKLPDLESGNDYSEYKRNCGQIQHAQYLRAVNDGTYIYVVGIFLNHVFLEMFDKDLNSIWFQDLSDFTNGRRVQWGLDTDAKHLYLASSPALINKHDDAVLERRSRVTGDITTSP